MMGQRGHHVIAIDGPAASGKSSVARRVAERLRFLFVNSGAMYRAVTWQALRRGLDPADEEAVLGLLDDGGIVFGAENGVSTIRIEGCDPGDALHGDAVNAAVSRVSAHPAVRERLIAEQRRYSQDRDVVMEGRDIGTAVFPETPLKFYLDASPEVRVRRRRSQGIEDNIQSRDAQDRSRKANPLRAADDAVVIDTSHLELEEVADKVLRHLHIVGVRPAPPESVARHMHPFYIFIKRLCQAYLCGVHGTQGHGFEKAQIPGGAFIAANHLSFLDPPIVGIQMPGAVYYLARETLLDSPVMRWVLTRLNLVAVDQTNLDLKTLRSVIRVVAQEGHKMVLFPEGARSLDGKLQAAQPGVGLLMAKSRVPVIPVRIFGSYEVYPARQKFPRFHGKIHVVCGDPIRFTDEELNAKGKDAYLKLSQRVMDEIARLEIPG